MAGLSTLPSKTATIGSFTGCCASVTTGHALAIAPTMNERRFTQ
jgi:hypothetical protein